MLKIEKLPKSSASPGNDVRGEAKHAKESLYCSFSAKADCVVRVRGGVTTGAESSGAGSLGSESLFPKLIHSSSTAVRRYVYKESIVEGHGSGTTMSLKIPSILFSWSMGK